VKCIHTTFHIRRPIRTAFAALPAGAIAVPAFAGSGTTTNTSAAAGCPTGWDSLPEASKYIGPGTSGRIVVDVAHRW
jgi:hypothetical protein